MRRANFSIAFMSRAAFVVAIVILTSCNYKQEVLTFKESKVVRKNVTEMVNAISADVSDKGPAAWMNYFEDVPGFMMASDGQLVFDNYQAAKTFVLETLVKELPRVKLTWSNLRVDPISTTLASIGAGYHEELTDESGKTQFIDGYFTGTAQLSNEGWKLRNLHWSKK